MGRPGEAFRHERPAPRVPALRDGARVALWLGGAPGARGARRLRGGVADGVGLVRFRVTWEDGRVETYDLTDYGRRIWPEASS